MTQPTDPSEIIKRTIANWQFIKAQQKAGQTVYEVTQLVNSFLAVVISPWPKHGKFWNTSLADAEKEGWPRAASTAVAAFEPRTLGEMLMEMRHALAHANIVFEGKTEIERIELSTFEGRKRKAPKWKASFSIGDLEMMLERFAAGLSGTG
jgi:HEPN family protein